MKFAYTTLIIVLLSLASGVVSARDAENDNLAAISWLAGDWAGIGEGQPGVSASTRHSVRVQNRNFIMVQGRSVYPKQERNNSGEVHSAIDLWSYDRQRNLLVMRQFDSLGFVSTYVQDRVASTDGRLVLVSEHLENVPVGWKARYTYTYRAPNEYRELFELDAGKGLELYVSGKFLRVEDEFGVQR
jgi:hypothetical protein